MKNKTLRRKLKVRQSIKGSTRPRLSVYKSNQHIYAQIIAKDGGKIMAQASDLTLEKTAKKGKKIEIAEKVGESIAKKALKANVSEVVFDRGSYNYHGRVKALAEAARKGGLKF